MKKDEIMNDSISRTKIISLLEMRAEFAANDDIFDELINIIGKVKKMPPVDAIPIEWILKWKEKFENAYSDEYDSTVAEMLVDMLEDWREENDKAD